jgi:hypothetical protein
MLICPACGHDNAFGSLICVRCYKLLPAHPTTVLNTTLQRSVLDPANAPALPPATTGSLVERLGSNDVNFAIKNASFVICVTRPVILGRYGADDSSKLHVDLSPFGAFEQGISRMHAAIKRVESGLIAEDLGSSNGTWLNHTKLQPYTPNPLNSGDILRLSTMEIRVYFRQIIKKDEPVEKKPDEKL